MSSDLIYSSNNIIANAMRSICIGYSLCVIIQCGIQMNFINKRGAYLPIISASLLMGFNIACIIIDIICLEIYQTNKMRILAHRDLIIRILAYVLFAIRAVSLIVLLFFYFDVTSGTGLYNLGNLALLFYLIRKSQIEGKNFSFGGVMNVFLFQDGLTFILAIILDIIFICIVSFVNITWIFSMTAGLANGFNLLILHIKYCTSLKTRVAGLNSVTNSPHNSANAVKRKSKVESGPATLERRPSRATVVTSNVVGSFNAAGSINAV
ncbi:hypothetical protein HDU96_000466 [Phlyctochytrium bullatum]|nr:hypothetical protein HDU96_000466 [Phlyctochytrium bullatum]